MSDDERLRREIQYLSGLIKQHKEGQIAVRGARNAWTLPNHQTNPSFHPGSTYVKYSRRRIKHHTEFGGHVPSKSYLASQAPTAALMARKMGVKFDSKFKWTKANTGNVTSLDKPSLNLSTLRKMPSTSSSSDMQKVVSQPSKSTVSSAQPVKNTRYKYQKTASEPRTESPAKMMSHQRRNTVQLKQSERHHNFSQKPMRKWHAKRHMGEAFTSKWTPKLRTHNPYILNRLTRPQPSASVSKKLHLARPGLDHNFSRKTAKSRKLDRRQRFKDTATHITLSKAALEGLLKKHSMTMKQVLANRAVVKSHETARYKKHEKKRQHCLYYGRFGKCMRGDSCKFIHDPSRIAVCTRFLRGTCREENCSFSHKVQKEKIPTCLFFLRGKCTATNCPYLHVYLGKEATICRTFATTGFCADADKCKMQHIRCCPEFYENGECPKAKSCKLPHLKMRNFSAKPTSSDSRKSDEPGTSKIRSGPDIKSDVQPSSASCPDFLSLKVETPDPLNKPIKAPSMHIKPRFTNLKPKSS